MYFNGLVTRHFETTFETVISTHTMQNVSLVFLFTYFSHIHEYCSLALIMNRPITKTFCTTSGVLNNVKPTCYEVVGFSLIRWIDIWEVGRELFHRLMPAGGGINRSTKLTYF